MRNIFKIYHQKLMIDSSYTLLYVKFLSKVLPILLIQKKGS